MPLSMSATTTVLLPVVTPQACGAWILLMSYCWPKDGSLGVSEPARTTSDRPEAENRVHGSISSTRGRAWRKQEEARCVRRGRKRVMRKLLGRHPVAGESNGDCTPARSAAASEFDVYFLPARGGQRRL